MDEEAIVYGEEVTGLLFAVADILVELRYISRLLEGADGEQEPDE